MKRKIVSALLILSILMSYATITYAESGTFSDVPQSHWAYETINELTNKGVINGMGDGTFAPEGTVTREQFMKLLVCALDCETDSEPLSVLTDVSSDSWSAPYISDGIRCGIYDVNADGDTFYPTDELKRGVSAEWAVDGLGVQTEAEDTFSDISDSGEQSKAIAIASKIGIVSGYEDNTFRADKTITRAEAAALIKRIMDYQTNRYALREDSANEIVLQDNVEIAESSNTANIPIAADEKNKIVTFSKADETLKALTAGEILFIRPCDNLPDGLLGKVVSVNNGANTKIKFEEPSLTEVIKSVDISTYVSADMNNFSDDGDLKAMSAVKGVASNNNGISITGGVEEHKNVISVIRGEFEADANASEKANIHFETKNYNNKKGAYAAIDMGVEVKVDMQLETDKFQITDFDVSADVLTDINAIAGYSNSVSKEYTYKLPSCSIPVGEVFSIDIDSSLVMKADGSLTIETTANLDNDIGIDFSLDKGLTSHKTTNANAGLTIDAEGSLKVGPKEDVTLVLAGIKIGDKTLVEGVSMLKSDVSFGIGANGKTSVDKKVSLSDSEISLSESNHLCYFCIEGNIIAYFNGNIGLGDDMQFLISKIYDKDLTYNFADVEKPLKDWHLSSGEGYFMEFELRKCPHKEPLPTDGARIVLTGTMGAYSYDEVLSLQGVPDPNPYTGQRWDTRKSRIYYLIILDTPQELYIRNGDGIGSSSGEVSIIKVQDSVSDEMKQYAGQHMTFSIDPENTWWPSGLDIPLGAPYIYDIQILN